MKFQFLSELVMTLLFCLSRKRVVLGNQCAPSPLYSYFYGRNSPLQLSGNWCSGEGRIIKFSESDVLSFRRWLEMQFQRYPGCNGFVLISKL